ncbi:MAG TPA: hypothetical protein K8V32_05420 [Enteractinococcus helveticum]|uniref:Uncharacterized protein n=1 Tax=Enteractinococcus helveticum TaxID=1837282 RepID=A0A921FNY4_9MICC|nr:hypothetical protein [Enteractinococcus helveticum]HJF14231.1 hypothetical protein [Enteractinococcus helveticum]
MAGTNQEITVVVIEGTAPDVQQACSEKTRLAALVEGKSSLPLWHHRNHT